MNYDQLGENHYLRNFPFRAHLRKEIPAKKFFPIDLKSLIEDSYLNSYLLDLVIGSFLIIKNTVYLC